MGRKKKLICLICGVMVIGFGWLQQAIADIYYGSESYSGEYSLKEKLVKEDTEELYLVNKKGKEQLVYSGKRELLDGKYWSRIGSEARWDWGGKKFLFFTYTGSDPAKWSGAERALWVGEIMADKSLRTRKVADEVFSASFSPDGTQIVFERQPETGRPGLYVLDLATGKERLVGTRVSTQGSIEQSPEWTIDGRYIFFLHGNSYWVLNLEEGGEHELKWLVNNLPFPGIFNPDSALFPSAHGNLMVISTMGFDAEPGKIWGLTIDLEAKAITKAEVLVKCDCFIKWIEPGRSVKVGWGTVWKVLDITGSEIKIIPDGGAGLISEEAIAAVEPCPITDSGIYSIKYRQPIDSGSGRYISSYFSHSNVSPFCADGSYC